MLKKATKEEAIKIERHMNHAKRAKAKRIANRKIPYVEREDSRQVRRYKKRIILKQTRVSPSEVGRRKMQVLKQVRHETSASRKVEIDA